MNIELNDAQKVKVRSDKDIYPVMREILLQANRTDRNKEHLWVCGLGANNLLLYVELVSLGTMHQSIVEPMDIFSWALQKQVAMIILVHNHPSETMSPSPADEDMTNRMIQVGKIVNISVVDHLIITPEEYYSFERHGLMEKLTASKKYVPGYIEVDRITKEAQRIGEERGAKDKAIEMAKTLKENGVDISLIAKSSGLSKEEIEKL